MTLDTYLKARSITGAEFAQRIGISEASLSRIRRGDQNITVELVRSIIDASGGEITANALVFTTPDASAERADAA